MTTPVGFVLAAAVAWAITHVTAGPSRPKPRPVRVHDERPVYGRRPVPSHTNDVGRRW